MLIQFFLGSGYVLIYVLVLIVAAQERLQRERRRRHRAYLKSLAAQGDAAAVRLLEHNNR